MKREMAAKAEENYIHRHCILVLSNIKGTGKYRRGKHDRKGQMIIQKDKGHMYKQSDKIYEEQLSTHAC